LLTRARALRYAQECDCLANNSTFILIYDHPLALLFRAQRIDKTIKTGNKWRKSVFVLMQITGKNVQLKVP
jgi:hypothetical protein